MFSLKFINLYGVHVHFLIVDLISEEQLAPSAKILVNSWFPLDVEQYFQPSIHECMI